MRIDLNAYDEKYHQQGKFIDNWQEGIKLLPYSSNPSSAFDSNCDLNGTTGEFFRLWENDGVSAIDDFEKSAVRPITKYLIDTKQMESAEAAEFARMLKDVLYVNGNLNITDSSLLKYVPLVPNDERILSNNRKKYSAGQRKLAQYLFSILPEDQKQGTSTNKDNLFTKILKEALTPSGLGSNSSIVREFSCLPFVQKSFSEDMKWMMEQEESVKVKYLRLLLHFYACYSVAQTLTCLSYKRNAPVENAVPFYFILKSEKVSVSHEAVTRGWTYQLPKTTLDKIFGRSQALDILNSVLGGNIGYYSNVFEALSSTPFEENRDACNELLKKYQADSISKFDRRDSEDGELEEETIEVNSYEEFAQMLEHLCIGYQSPSYVSRMRKKVIDLMSVRFLQNRKRCGYVLALDNEMLTFLIAMLTRCKKTKLDELYKRFNSYGIYFNRESRIAIEEYLLKLNLLDRKSDSGETQYVTVVL